MAALDKDTRLIMTILFVGTISGTNVFLYANFGISFPYGPLEHGVLFGLITVGSILVMKAINDLLLNDWIESWLLDRRIRAYWEIKSKEEEQRKRMKESLKTFRQDYNTVPRIPQYSEEEGIGAEFLTSLQ